MKTNRRNFVRGVSALAVLGGIKTASAEKKYSDGASDTEIRIGHTGPYSGPASSYGVIGKSIEAYWKMVNDKGGINGRKVTFITYDDGYSPPKTVEMTRKLVEQDKVLCIFNPLGTPTSTAVHKYMNRKKVPHLFIGAGATKWGDPEHFPWTIGWQPDYQTEAGIYAKHALAEHKGEKICMLWQNDDAGKDYAEGFLKGLGKENEKLVVASVSYEPTDATVDSQIIQLKNSGATVLFSHVIPKQAAQAIRKAAELGWKHTHYLANVSASVGAVMKPAGFENCQGIISSAYLKDPTDPQWASAPDFVQWKEWMEKYQPAANQADQFNVYAYAVSATMHEMLKECGDELTRENLMKHVASMKDLEIPLLLPSIKLNTSATDYYPIQSMRLQRFKGEGWELFGDIISSEHA
ncbi:MAG TPA: ABC transporter substrate-binding protein [Reyranella sp.]|nr:ABC transporter substrate-binding protein [Reyranella sp.]